MCRYLFLLFYVYPLILGRITVNNSRDFDIIKWSPPGKGDFPEFAQLVLPSANVTGRLVYVVHPPFTSYAYYTEPFLDRIEAQAKRGAIGCITSPRDGRVPGHVIFGALGVRQLQIPIGMVSKEVIDFANLEKNKIANISFLGYDENPWTFSRSGPGYVIFSVVIGGCYLFNVLLSGYRLINWIRVINGIDYTIGFLCLTLEFFCNLTRIFQVIFYGAYNNYSLAGTSVLITIPFCITLITSIIIVFFWLDLTSDPFYHGKFLGIMKIPAGIFIVICLVLEAVSDVMRNITMVDFMNYIVNFYGASLALVSIFNFIAAFRVLQSLKRDTKKKLRKIIYRIIASGIATIFGVINLFVFLNPTVNWTPYGWLLLWFFLYFTFWLQSFLMILIFQVPKKEKAETAKETVKQKSEESNETDLDSKSTET